MSKIEDYRGTLKKLDDWIPFLRKNSGLPGPRGNLELAHAVAHEGSKRQFEQFLATPAEENTPEVFLVFCGLVGLGQLAANEPGLFDRLRKYASDRRWRVREAVATGLQLAGDQNIDLLLNEMQKWSRGNWYEKRAAAATLAEPRLLKDPQQVASLYGFSMRSQRQWRGLVTAGMTHSKSCGKRWDIAGVWSLPHYRKQANPSWKSG